MSSQLIEKDVAEMNIPLWKANCWFIVLWLAMLLDHVDRMAVNAVLPMLKKEFALTDAQSGLVSSILGLTMISLAIPTAIIVDKWSRRKTAAIMIAFWSICTLATGLAKGYGTLLLARLGVGAGEAGYGPGAYALISAWYPKKMRGTMFGLFFSATPLGFPVGVAGAGYLAYHFGWRACFGILAVPGIIIAVLAWFMPDYKTVKIEQGKEQAVSTNLKGTLLYIFKSPTLIFVYLASASTVLASQIFTTWGVTFFVRTFTMNIKEAAAVVGIIGLITALGAPFAGWLGDQFLKKNSKGRILTASLCCSFFLAFILLALNNTSGSKNYPFILLFWSLSNFFLVGVNLNLIAVTQDIVAPTFRIMTVAFIPIVNQILAGVPGPVIAGAISDRMGLTSTLAIMSIISMGFAILCNILSAKYYDRDYEKMRQLGTFKLNQE